jgi:signal transduction histidine kinase
VSSAERSGFGVGLWIARQLAVAHGGDIAVESLPGVGSIFTATLPRGIHEPQS